MCGASTLPSPSSKYPIAYIEIRVFSHATEDMTKVETAVKNSLPDPLSLEISFTNTNCVGHHGNPIVLMETKLNNQAELPHALKKIASGLNSLDKEQLVAEVWQHIEKHNLYLRFDKQSAYMGALKIAQKDAIHFKINFKNKIPEEIVDICRQVGLLP